MGRCFAFVRARGGQEIVGMVGRGKRWRYGRCGRGSGRGGASGRTIREGDIQEMKIRQRTFKRYLKEGRGT